MPAASLAMMVMSSEDLCCQKLADFNKTGTFFMWKKSVCLGTTFECASISTNSGLSSLSAALLQKHTDEANMENSDLLLAIAGRHITLICNKIHLKKQQISWLYYCFWKACSRIPLYHLMVLTHIFSFDHVGGLSHTLQLKFLFQTLVTSISGDSRP